MVKNFDPGHKLREQKSINLVTFIKRASSHFEAKIERDGNSIESDETEEEPNQETIKKPEIEDGGPETDYQAAEETDLENTTGGYV